MNPLTVALALAEAKARGVERLDAQLLLARALERPRSWLMAHDDATLSPELDAAFRADLQRRADGEPLAYLLGEKEFHGLLLKVSANVLVPRPETELLVDWALELLNGELAGHAPPRVLDLGTGSGAIALAIKHAQPNAIVDAVDVSPAALDVAGTNAQQLGLDITLRQGHWWEGVSGSRFDLAVSNPPYIHPKDPHLDALCHEPDIALTPGGPDGNGLEALQAIVDGAADHLQPSGWLLLEHGHDQATALCALLVQHGFVDVQTRLDLAGLPRCTGAHR